MDGIQQFYYIEHIVLLMDTEEKFERYGIKILYSSIFSL